MAIYEVRNLFYAALVIVITLLTQFIYKFVKHRAFYGKLPGPPHSWLTGHIIPFGELMQSFPPNAHPQGVIDMMIEKYNLPRMFYIDMFPLSPSMLMIQDAAVAAQVYPHQRESLPRHPFVLDTLLPFSGPQSILHSRGSTWKNLRTVLAPSFSPANLFAMMPTMSDPIKVFRERLLELADSEQTFVMQEVASAFTIDIISTVVMGECFNWQQSWHPIAYYFRAAIQAPTSVLNIFQKVYGEILRTYYSFNLNRALNKAISSRFAQRQGDKANLDGQNLRCTSTLDRLLDSFQSPEGLVATKQKKSSKIDDNVRNIIRDNVKAMLFAGHDNSATNLCFVIHLLHKHQDVLTRVREEHDAVFGTDIDQAVNLMVSQPRLLKQLPWTTAVIRETMRIFPTGNVPRIAPPGTFVTDFDGQEHDISGNHFVWVNQFSMHRNSDEFDDATKFRPERFLNKTLASSEFYRPFEKGPQNCVGLELAILELEICLVLVSRQFDCVPAYPESSQAALEKYGGLVYQTFQNAVRPNLGLPLKIKKRSLGNGYS